MFTVRGEEVLAYRINTPPTVVHDVQLPLELMTHSMLTKHLQPTVTLKSGLNTRGPWARVVPQRGPMYIRQSRILFHCNTSLKVLQR